MYLYTGALVHDGSMAKDPPLEFVHRSPEDTNGPRPAAVLVHGRGADERDLLPIGSQLPDGMHVFSVRAPIDLDDGYAWYDLDVQQGGLHDSQPETETFRRSMVRLSAFLEFVVDAYPVREGSVGLLGFSQGATVSLAAMTEVHERIDWIAALHGHLAKAYDNPAALADARSVPIFLAAGRMDLVIPEERVERSRDRLEAAGLDVTYRTYPVGHGANDEEVSDVTNWITARLQ